MGFWSGLGKVFKTAAPIAASFIPGVGPIAGALIGAGTGAATGAMGGGGKGALIGGLLGAGGGALGGVAKGATGLKGALSKVGGSLVSSLGNPDTLSGMSRGVGAIAGTQAHNRGVALDAMMEADKMRMLQDKQRMDEESDLWKKLQAMNYIKAGGKKPAGPQMSASGRAIPSFSFGPTPISGADQAVASTLEKQLLNRLNNPAALRDYDSKMNPGKAETLMNWLGPGLGIAGDVLRGIAPKQTPTAPEVPMPPSIFAPGDEESKNPYSNVVFDRENPYLVQTPKSIFNPEGR